MASNRGSFVGNDRSNWPGSFDGHPTRPEEVPTGRPPTEIYPSEIAIHGEPDIEESLTEEDFRDRRPPANNWPAEDQYE